MPRQAIIPIGPSIAYIKLTKGLFALIDREDADLLQQHNWFAHWSTGASAYYAARHSWTPQGNISIRMHAVLCPCPIGKRPDHRNTRTLDNRRCNLRPATPSESRLNTRKPKNNKSGFKGVSAVGDKWKGCLNVRRVHYYLGLFATPELAAEAVAAEVKLRAGEFGRTS